MDRTSVEWIPPPLHIVQRQHATGLTLEVTGEIDLATAEELAAAVRAAVPMAAIRGLPMVLVLDLRAVRLLSAAGLRVLADAHAECAASGVIMLVIADHPAVLRPLRITRADRVFAVLPAPPAEDGPVMLR